MVSRQSHRNRMRPAGAALLAAAAPAAGGGKRMVTIVTDVELKEGAERRWDAVMRQRMNQARKRRGWIGGQLLRSEEDPKRRLIVGTWKARTDWEQWHKDREFAATRQR